MNIKYPAIVSEQEEGGYIVSFPDMDEAFTEGDTLDEAIYNAVDVLTLTLESRVDEGMPVPEPSTIDNAVYIAPSPRVQAALLVRISRGNSPLSDLAKRLETSWPSASRLENPHHWPSLKQLDRAASALGKRLMLSFE